MYDCEFVVLSKNKNCQKCQKCQKFQNIQGPVAGKKEKGQGGAAGFGLRTLGNMGQMMNDIDEITGGWYCEFVTRSNYDDSLTSIRAHLEPCHQLFLW